MVCLIDAEQKTINTFMWLFTILLAIGIILWFVKDLKPNSHINKWVPMTCAGIGIIGSIFLGVTSKGKAKEGFSAIYGV